MQTLEIIQGIHQGISPYLDIESIEITFKKNSKKTFQRLTEENPMPFDMGITIFYGKDSNNFTTD